MRCGRRGVQGRPCRRGHPCARRPRRRDAVGGPRAGGGLRHRDREGACSEKFCSGSAGSAR
uniref:Uncharacterized protein n=1 Tax=Arundo donax TaxID=35708 RepID=A0A0A9FAM9_ARUDO